MHFLTSLNSCTTKLKSQMKNKESEKCSIMLSKMFKMENCSQIFQLFNGSTRDDFDTKLFNETIPCNLCQKMKKEIF